MTREQMIDEAVRGKVPSWINIKGGVVTRGLPPLEVLEYYIPEVRAEFRRIADRVRGN
jgi:hypothetical protein